MWEYFEGKSGIDSFANVFHKHWQVSFPTSATAQTQLNQTFFGFTAQVFTSAQVF
jgi:hypothetical protein